MGAYSSSLTSVPQSSNALIIGCKASARLPSANSHLMRAAALPIATLADKINPSRSI